MYSPVTSNHCWYFLVTNKVLVLPRVISHIPKYLEEEVSNIEPLDSNIYSKPERVLLAWLNFHYKEQRERLLRETGNSITGFFHQGSVNWTLHDKLWKGLT